MTKDVRLMHDEELREHEKRLRAVRPVTKERTDAHDRALREIERRERLREREAAA